VYARDNRHLLDITLNKISSIPGIVSAETFLMSLDEVFRRQLSAFDITDEDDKDVYEE
jgi:Lrp/AsnC family transcriptional regulator for asnA, asnC and gidA